METIEQLKAIIEDLKKSNSFLQKKNNYYESPSPYRAYYVGQKVLNQYVDYLDKFNLEQEITSNPKEDKVYDRAIDLFEKLTTNASRLNSLRLELSISGDEKKDIFNAPKVPYSPELVADQVGELAGRKNS